MEQLRRYLRAGGNRASRTAHVQSSALQGIIKGECQSQFLCQTSAGGVHLVRGIAYVRPSAWQKAAVGFTAERLRLADEEEKPTQKKGPVDHYPLPSFSNVLLPTPPNSPPLCVGIPLASAVRVRNFQWHRQPSAKACAWPPPAPAPSLRRSAPLLPFPGNESGGFVAAVSKAD
jgi:hypothetical protein